MLGYFDLEKREYRHIEMMSRSKSFRSSATLLCRRPKKSPRAYRGRKIDGTAHGGHLLKGWVQPTLEVLIVESPGFLARQIDEATGLPLDHHLRPHLPMRQLERESGPSPRAKFPAGAIAGAGFTSHEAFCILNATDRLHFTLARKCGSSLEIVLVGPASASAQRRFPRISRVGSTLGTTVFGMGIAWVLH